MFSFPTDLMQLRRGCNKLFQKHLRRNILENMKKLCFEGHTYVSFVIFWDELYHKHNILQERCAGNESQPIPT